MYKRYRYNKKRMRLPEVSLTPLIDTALTLLVIFMVTAPMIPNGIKIELPKGQQAHASPVSGGTVVLQIDKDGALFIKGKRIDKAQVINELQAAIATVQDKTVYIHGDKDVRYEEVHSLFDKLAGTFDVVLSSQKSI